VREVSAKQRDKIKVSEIEVEWNSDGAGDPERYFQRRNSTGFKSKESPFWLFVTRKISERAQFDVSRTTKSF